MKFVVIGGDAAGMSAASKAKRNNPDMQVTVFEMTQDVSYSACGMPYNIADPERDMDELIVRRAEAFRKKQEIDLLTGHLVESIDVRRMKVRGAVAMSGEAFECDYDKLLIATGGSAIRPSLAGFDLPGVVVLKSLGDGRRIKQALRERYVKKVVIVGMGYVGLEMCEALRKRSIAVDMIKPGPIFLPWLDPELSNAVKEEVTRNQIGLHPGVEIEKIEENGDGLSIECRDEKILTADLVLVAMGITPNSEIAANAGLEIGVSDSIAVNRQLQTSDENIYAAGDCADAYHVVTGEKTWVPLALRANRAGWAVADHVCGKPVSVDGIAGTAVFRVFEMEVARTGLNPKEAEAAGFDPVGVSIQTRSRAHGHPGSQTIWVQMTADRSTGRLLGVQMAGKEGVAHRINAPAVALHNQTSIEEYFQSDLAYAPPFGPVWDPTLTAANQLLKKL